MPTYERRELHTTRVEYHVPAPAPWGAAWVEVYKAVTAAHQELRAAGQIGEGDAPDDLVSIAPHDDAVVVSYELRTDA